MTKLHLGQHEIEVIACEAVPEGEMYFISPRRRNEPLKAWARRCLHVTGIGTFSAMYPGNPEDVGSMQQLAMAATQDEIGQGTSQTVWPKENPND